MKPRIDIDVLILSNVNPFWMLFYACSLPEWLTCVDNELAERAVETNHRILSKGGVREFQLI
jgi:hypothetical protein